MCLHNIEVFKRLGVKQITYRRKYDFEILREAYVTFDVILLRLLVVSIHRNLIKIGS